jgi:PAS domain S-box-containing protein
MSHLMPEDLQQLKDLKTALDNSAIVAITDARGRISVVNEKFCEISGYSRSELIGQDHRILNSGSHPKAFFQQMWQAISTGRIWQGEICNRKKNGDLYWVGTTITPFLDENGRPYMYVAVRQDITELKNAQAQIVDQEMQLVNASRLSAIGEMAAAITHEINNPLAVILGRTEMIQALLAKNQTDQATLTRLVDTIQTTAKRIEKIIRGMKTLAHHSRDDEPMTITRVAEIVVDSSELCAQRFRNHGVRLAVPEVDPQLTVECRSHEIVQVLVNLLNNAFDAVEKLDERWVQITVTSNTDFIELAVTDSGKGIPLEHQTKLFQPFFSTKRVQYGTGLGLSISRSIVKKHHGDLLYDAENPNTRFIIRLKRRQS